MRLGCRRQLPHGNEKEGLRPFSADSLTHKPTAYLHHALNATIANRKRGLGPRQAFPSMVLENLRTAVVQQAHKEDRVSPERSEELR